MRRYWQPIAVPAKVTTTPQEVRILGEALILFRNGQGRPGLVVPACAHRGAPLFFGNVEERGFRCCYHGWLFDVEGRCLDMPCEPGNGVRVRERIRQPWYLVQELYGLVFAYMGPPDKRPILPVDERVRPASSRNRAGGSIQVAVARYTGGHQASRAHEKAIRLRARK
jgi:phenylpropionate dioxygenase-like ring-hydroxylating dioxygenase large terminal subunit